MPRIVAVAAFLAGIALAREPVKAVQSARPFEAGATLPVMDHGWLIALGRDSPTIYVQRPDGTPAYTATVRVPSGVRPSLMDAAVDAGGGVAVGIAYRGGETGVEGAIVLLDPSGNQTSIHSTGR